MDLTPGSIAVLALVSALVVDRILFIFRQHGIDLRLIATQIGDLHERHGAGSEIARQIDDLHKWHDVQDNEGVKIWYVRRSLEDAIVKLADNIDAQTKVFLKMDRRLDTIESGVSSFAEDSKEILRRAES